MNCAEWQQKIALFTGADLPENEAPSVEDHLSACEECRTFERELSEARAMLLSMRTIDEGDLAVVRSKVLHEIEGRTRRSVWAWAPYAAALAALVIGWTAWRPVATVTKPRASVTELRPPGSGISEPHALASGGAGAAANRPRRAKPRRTPQAEPVHEPTVVTLFTDDPDVVIVWITD